MDRRAAMRAFALLPVLATGASASERNQPVTVQPSSELISALLDLQVSKFAGRQSKCRKHFDCELTLSPMRFRLDWFQSPLFLQLVGRDLRHNLPELHRLFSQAVKDRETFEQTVIRLMSQQA
jgi:hypothetical protein